MESEKRFLIRAVAFKEFLMDSKSGTNITPHPLNAVQFMERIDADNFLYLNQGFVGKSWEVVEYELHWQKVEQSSQAADRAHILREIAEEAAAGRFTAIEVEELTEIVNRPGPPKQGDFDYP